MFDIESPQSLQRETSTVLDFSLAVDALRLEQSEKIIHRLRRLHGLIKNHKRSLKEIII
jgi:hypothetical protein